MKRVLRTTDLLTAASPIGPAMLIGKAEIPLQGTGKKWRDKGTSLFVQGDEARVMLPGAYTAGAYSIPGNLLLKVDGPPTLSRKLKVGGKWAVLADPVNLKGKPAPPAIQPGPAPTPDGNGNYPGQKAGKFLQPKAKTRSI